MTTPATTAHRTACLLLLACVAATAACHASTPAPLPESVEGKAGTTHILVLGSLTLDPEGPYARNMRDWMNRFVALMRKEGVPLENITILAETADTEAQPPVAVGTLVNVRAAFERLAETVGPRDQFILFIVGYGTTTEPVAKLCLPGPDLTGPELARKLDELPTTQIVILNFAAGGAEFLPDYTRPGRVVVSAAGKMGQGAQTVLAEFLLWGYESGQADANGDGRITVLEAFNWSSSWCTDWYRRQLPGVIVTGKDSCRIFQKLYEGTDLKYDAANSKPNAPDGRPVFAKARRTEYLFFSCPQNRLPSEMATLEDQGDYTEAVSVEVAAERVLVEVIPGEQGDVAAKTRLGHPWPDRDAKAK